MAILNLGIYSQSSWMYYIKHKIYLRFLLFANTTMVLLVVIVPRRHHHQHHHITEACHMLFKDEKGIDTSIVFKCATYMYFVRNATYNNLTLLFLAVNTHNRTHLQRNNLRDEITSNVQRWSICSQTSISKYDGCKSASVWFHCRFVVSISSGCCENCRTIPA